MTYRPRIGYDARFSLGKYRGMGTLVRHAISNSSADFVGLCATGETDPELALLAKGFRSYPLWEQISIPRRLRELRLDFFLAPYNTAPLYLPKWTRLIMVIHDVIFMERRAELAYSSSLYQNAGRFYRRVIVPRVVARAEIILTVSEFSKQEIVSRLQVDPARVRVIPSSIPNSWYNDAPVPTRERGNYILCVGGEAPSKNVNRAFQAYALLRQSLADNAPELRIGGISTSARQPFADLASQLSISQYVTFLPYLSTDELQSMYRRAKLVLVPSLREGFGLPPLEAMASGTPVVSSNRTSLPEVGGDAPLYICPEDTNDIANGLAAVLSDPVRQMAMIDKGLRRAAEFYEITKRMYAQFWAELARTSGRNGTVGK